ncbi:MAG TPA: flagellar assembly protein FliX [Rhizomicrobium sp.]
MEIYGPRRVEAATVRRVAKGASGTGGAFQLSDAGETRGAVVSGPGPIGALDSILMLQGLDDSMDGRGRAVAHGEALLDMLDQVRDGLLAGGVPRTTLNRLANAVTRRHDQFNDPKLQSVLDEIELRAHVELAKLEMSDSRLA